MVASAALTDRQTADDTNPDGSQNTEAFRITLTFSHGVVDAFQVDVDTFTLQLGTYVTLSARGFRLDTSAAGTTNVMLTFQSLGAKVAISSLVIGGEAAREGDCRHDQEAGAPADEIGERAVRRAPTRLETAGAAAETDDELEQLAQDL